MKQKIQQEADSRISNNHSFKSEINMNESKLQSTGFPIEWFVDPPERAKCTICFQILNEPRNCRNGHLFCFECIKMTTSNDNQMTCPTCKTSMKEQDLGLCLYVKEVNMELNAHCSCFFKTDRHQEQSDNCGWNGMFKDRATRTCAYQMVKCSNEGCNVSVQRRLLKIHKGSECELRQEACPFCKSRMRFAMIGDHKKQCVDRPVKCSGCSVILPFCQLNAHHETCSCNCPLFTIGKCAADCTGQVKPPLLEAHLRADAALVAELAETVHALQVQLMAERRENVARKVKRKADGPAVEGQQDPTEEASFSTFHGGATLFVAGLAYETTENTLYALYGWFGSVRRVSIPRLKNTNTSRGHAFVTLGSPQEAQNALTRTDGIKVDGREIRVELESGVQRARRVCSLWKSNKMCSYGDTCQYAHL